MRRAGLVVLITAFTLGLVGSTAANDKPPKVKVESTVTIEGFDVGEETVTFFGNVDAEKKRPKCVPRRTVNLEQTSKGIHAGSDRTDEEGDWAVTFQQEDVPPGEFQAEVIRKKIKKRRNGEVVKKIICRRDESETFDVFGGP
jgi:hypothetical protein